MEEVRLACDIGYVYSALTYHSCLIQMWHVCHDRHVCWLLSLAQSNQLAYSHATAYAVTLP